MPIWSVNQVRTILKNSPPKECDQIMFAPDLQINLLIKHKNPKAKVKPPMQDMNTLFKKNSKLQSFNSVF